MQKPRIFLFGLSGKSSLYLTDAPLICITLVKSLISKLWTPGLQNEKRGLVVYNFKLRGNPWFQGKRKAIRARFLVICILEELRFLGWKTQAALNPTGGSNDVTCFCMESSTPLNCTYLSITFVGDDTLWLINAPDSAVDDLRQVLSALVMPIKLDDRYKGCHRFQFCDSMAKVPSVICVILETLSKSSWTFVTTAATSKHYIGNSDPLNRIWSNAAHSMFFEKNITVEDSL